MSSVGHNSTTNAVMREDFRLFPEGERDHRFDRQSHLHDTRQGRGHTSMKVSEIMTGKERVADIPATFSIREAFDFCHSRNMIKAPVYSVSADGTHVWNGVFNIYDAIFSVDEKLWDTTKAVSCLRPLHELDGNSTLSETLEHSRKNKVSMFAIVEPENRRQVGILKPEDIAGMLFE
jgi:CBS domain containing-hemolysin-like protein